MNESKNIFNQTADNDSTECIFSSNAGLSSSFDVFASDEPLTESKNELQLTRVNNESPWTSAIEKAQTTNDNEPWELDVVVEKKTDSNQNCFADSFVPLSGIIDQTEDHHVKEKLDEPIEAMISMFPTLSNEEMLTCKTSFT